MEEWRDIEGYEGLYQVSNYGRIYSLITFKVLKTRVCRNGYLLIDLHKGKKASTFYVHRLVAQNFLPNPINLPEVNHIDEDKTNNHIDNLAWVTCKDNCNHGTRNARCTTRKQAVICIETGIIYESTREASRQTGIDQGSISKCCRNIPHYITAGGYHWVYA